MKKTRTSIVTHHLPYVEEYYKANCRGMVFTWGNSSNKQEYPVTL